MATTFTPSTTVPNNTYALPITKSVHLDADAFLMKRDFLRNADQTWEDDDFLSFLELGNERLVQASNFYHYEQGLLFREVYPAAIIGTATAASVTFTLTPASYTTTGDGIRTPLKEKDIVHLLGDVYGRVSIKSKTTGGTDTQFTITRRTGSTDDLGAAITASIAQGKAIAIPTDAHKEGSGFTMEGLDTPMTRYTGQFQTIKSYQAITGDAASHMMEIQVEGTQYYWNKLTIQMLKRHRIKQKMALMFSPGGNFDENGEVVPLTASLRGTLKAFGNRLLYDPTAGFTLADLDKFINQVKLLTGDKEVHMFIGPTLRGQIEGLIRQFTLNGGINYNTFGGGDGGKKRMVDLGFDCFRYHDITVYFQEYRLHPSLTGLDWQSFDREALVMPANMVNVQYADKNGAQSVNVNALTLCYKKQSNGVDRRFKEVNRDQNVTFNDTIERGLQSQEGLQYVGVRRGFFIGPNS